MSDQTQLDIFPLSFDLSFSNRWEYWTANAVRYERIASTSPLPVGSIRCSDTCGNTDKQSYRSIYLLFFKMPLLPDPPLAVSLAQDELYFAERSSNVTFSKSTSDLQDLENTPCQGQLLFKRKQWIFDSYSVI
jgi:hypothetical protein